MSEHQIIWLQPWCADCELNSYGDGRLWCDDPSYLDPCEGCGAMPVKYILAPDQPQKPEPEADED
jgi:hypothetical protein